ncbi:cytosol aminopeptidase [Candidatus Phycosocius bacilliformis]|uniref:Probable cytosol aminopeptidase n=1 Tax=Candidatus Phycosocius bacilliformis TaxID=1445552 RepID=A0A2P2E7R4_9PROT|nr:leucyl aminopeptidase [Candidatus Phycosocius bacilliformis]GBF57108.1 cytosol aminopeptidase [Candidatus Phycosocius bacilliformis]
MKIEFTSFTESKAVIAFVGQTDGTVAFSVPAQKLDRACKGRLAKAAAAAKFNGAAGKVLSVHAPNDKLDVVVLVGVGELAKVDGAVLERAAASGVKSLLTSGVETASVALAGWKKLATAVNAARVGFGACLAAYRFDTYRTQLKPEQKPSLTTLEVDVAEGAEAWAAHQAVVDGVSLARDLVNEPANILHPEAFAKRLKELTALGVEVEILGEAQMAALGMHSLLGVGQGSVRESQLVVMKWNGGGDEAPLALVGKGVCFDTGGISLKPSGGMEEMKGDMGGAAAVAGAMRAIAGRKAKANVVGLVGLVENMPDGQAQRPGDIVTSMSGQTIEILNTDAEGRLVLCDVMTYAQEKHKPKAMIDLATLTGAIIISLGHEFAGLFSNSDALSAKITQAGTLAEEPVWRFPLTPAYNKLMDSSVADMKNVQRSGGGAGAGSITAAQFLQRFVQDGVEWAHIDIAGTAWKPGNDDPREPSWGTGYGVRLLNRLVADAFES